MRKRSVLPLLLIGIDTVFFLSAIYISTNLRIVSQIPHLLNSEEQPFSVIPLVTR